VTDVVRRELDEVEARIISQAASFDQTNATACVDSRDCLRVLRIRIHPRGRIEKPHARQDRCLSRVAFVTGKPEGEGERFDRIARARLLLAKESS